MLHLRMTVIFAQTFLGQGATKFVHDLGCFDGQGD